MLILKKVFVEQAGNSWGVIGGAGYIASAFLNYGGLEATWVSMLTIPATIGEFWMISYLLIFGIRPQS